MVRNCTERQLGKTEIDKGATVQAKGEKMESNGLLQLRRGEDRKQGVVAVEKGRRWKAAAHNEQQKASNCKKLGQLLCIHCNQV